jgi:hypothetical protein
MEKESPTVPLAAPDDRYHEAGNRILLLSLSALGIVFGDIGTSPIMLCVNVFRAHLRFHRRNQTSLAYCLSSSGRSNIEADPQFQLALAAIAGKGTGRTP